MKSLPPKDTKARESVPECWLFELRQLLYLFTFRCKMIWRSPLVDERIEWAVINCFGGMTVVLCTVVSGEFGVQQGY